MLTVNTRDFFKRFDRGIGLAGIFEPLVDLERNVKFAGDFTLGAVRP